MYQKNIEKRIAKKQQYAIERWRKGSGVMSARVIASLLMLIAVLIQVFHLLPPRIGLIFMILTIVNAYVTEYRMRQKEKAK